MAPYLDEMLHFWAGKKRFTKTLSIIIKTVYAKWFLKLEKKEIRKINFKKHILHFYSTSKNVL